VIFIAAAIAFLAWGSIIRITADAREGDVALWIYDTDVVRGGQIEARVRIDGGLRARIVGIAIEGGGKHQFVAGEGQQWGKKIVSSVFDRGTAEVDFQIAVPPDTSPGTTLHLEIAIDTVIARAWFVRSFGEEERHTIFHRDVVVHSPLAGALRRLGRAAIALGSAGAVIALLVLARAWYLRRDRRPGSAWIFLLVPHGGLGYAVILPQLSAATGLHGAFFGFVCLATWYAILAIPGRLTLPFGVRRYTVSPAMIPTEAMRDPYRSAHVSPVVQPAIALEAAWMASDLVVSRKRRALSVALPGVEPAIVPVPRSGTFGGGPFEIFSSDRHTVMKMLDAVAPLLGELRCGVQGEPGELQFRAGARRS
jgi:hypothetical protein